MRTFLLLFPAALVVATAVGPSSARAEIVYPWCAISSSAGLGQPLCHFATLEQCTAFLNGLTGSCRPNGRAVAPEQTNKRGAR
jgi:hypothetical protein